MKKIFIIAPIVFAIVSCAQKNIKQANTSVLHLEIPVGEVQQVKMSDIISEFKAIKLEFTENSMIGYPKKIIFDKDLIYVLDTFGAKSLMVFTMEGKFIQRIGSLGKGPGQYILPKDFVIDTLKNEIEILGNRKINHFSMNGDFLRRNDIAFTSLDFFKLSNDYFFAISGKEDFKIIQTDIDGTVKGKFLPTLEDYVDGNENTCFISLKNQQLLFRPTMRDTLYCLNEGTPSPVRIIEFGKYRFQQEKYKTLPWQEKMQIRLYKNNINQCLISRYLENNNHIHITYNVNSKYYEYIYNKNTNNEISFNRDKLIDDITWEKDSWYLSGGDNEYFYYMIQPYKYKTTNHLRKFLKSFTTDEECIQEMLHETSNPIILLAKYKV